MSGCPPPTAAFCRSGAVSTWIRANQRGRQAPALTGQPLYGALRAVDREPSWPAEQLMTVSGETYRFAGRLPRLVALVRDGTFPDCFEGGSTELHDGRICDRFRARPVTVAR